MNRAAIGDLHRRLRRAQQAALSEELATPRPLATGEPIVIRIPVRGTVAEALLSGASAPLMFFALANVVLGIRYTNVVYGALAVIATVIAITLILRCVEQPAHFGSTIAGYSSIAPAATRWCTGTPWSACASLLT